jgi:hypothetical protein
MLDFLSSLTQPEWENIKAIYTSRDELDIREALKDFVSISIAARSHDLELFGAAGIESRIKEKRLQLRDPTMKEFVINTIVAGASGMYVHFSSCFLCLELNACGSFQWAKCQLDQLCYLSTDKERCQALETLPLDLFETYRRILSRINISGQKHLVERVLRWLAWATRPLTLYEVRVAVAITINECTLTDEDIPNEESILFWSNSLIVLNKKTGILALSHFTVREFLRSSELQQTPGLQSFYMAPSSYAILAKVCLTYLNLQEFSRVATVVANEDEGIIGCEALSRYRDIGRALYHAATQ